MTRTQAGPGQRVSEAAPTAADAQLLVQLAQLAASMDVDRGMDLLRKHARNGGLDVAQLEATYPLGGAEHTAILAVLKWHETIGTLVKQGLLHRALVLDWLWVAGVWDMCSGIALGHRAETGVPQMWENFEALAATQ